MASTVLFRLDNKWKVEPYLLKTTDDDLTSYMQMGMDGTLVLLYNLGNLSSLDRFDIKFTANDGNPTGANISLYASNNKSFELPSEVMKQIQEEENRNKGKRIAHTHKL